MQASIKQQAQQTWTVTAPGILAEFATGVEAAEFAQDLLLVKRMCSRESGLLTDVRIDQEAREIRLSRSVDMDLLDAYRPGDGDDEDDELDAPEPFINGEGLQ